MNEAGQVPGKEDAHTQDKPVLDQDDVSERTKLSGIVAQTLSDLGGQHPLTDIEAVVRQRSAESGLSSSSEEVSAAVQEAIGDR